MAPKKTRAKKKDPHPSDSRSPAGRERTRLRKLLFAEAYWASEDKNATDAARKAGYAESRVRKEGSRLLADPEVQVELARLVKEQSERTQITADAVLDRLWSIATADPNELVEYRRTCCRYCYGTEHRYQSTLNEMRRNRAAWEAKQAKSSKEVFDERGGDGYTATQPPNPTCPECFGDGDGRAHFKDTRHLSAKAKRLYLGVKITKGGIEVCMLNPMDALVNVGKHLGLFSEAKEPPENEDDRARKIKEAIDAMDEATDSDE